MIRSATSANATTSARRITGGASALLSGTGVPSDAVRGWRSPGWAFWRSLGNGLEDTASAGTASAGTGLLGATLTIVLPPREAAMTRQKRRRPRPELKAHNVGLSRRFHRGSVSMPRLDSPRLRASRTEPRSADPVDWPEHHPMRIQRGSVMTQYFVASRRYQSRLANAV